MIAAKGQIEHTKSERSILCEIRHPYIVRLRFAFQSAEKLYLVTDYYNSGTLFYHLRKCGKFPAARAKFYACELLSAIDHLHQQSIIYRDLKLENILMAHSGHIGNNVYIHYATSICVHYVTTRYTCYICVSQLAPSVCVVVVVVWGMSDMLFCDKKNVFPISY